MKKRTQCANLCLLVFAICIGRAAAQEIAVVYPNEFENVEGADGADGNAVWQNGVHLQLVFLASEFESLPDVPQFILGYRSRPDGVLTTSAISRSWRNLSIQLSTTDITSPSGLSPIFENNLGNDAEVVYDGPITLSTQNEGPDGGPKVFDYEFRFETPFLFDPNQGNLLIDWMVDGPFQDSSYDLHASNDYGFGLFAPDANATSSSNPVRNSVIYEFVFSPVPEPSSATVCLTGLLGLLQLRKRRSAQARIPCCLHRDRGRKTT